MRRMYAAAASTKSQRLDHLCDEASEELGSVAIGSLFQSFQTIVLPKSPSLTSWVGGHVISCCMMQSSSNIESLRFADGKVRKKK